MRKPLFCLALAAASAWGQQPFEFWPGASYDPAVPTFQKVLGYPAGERISSHANLMKYLEALAAAAPRRMKIFEYAKSWQGRKLIYAVVGSEPNIRRLDHVRAAMQKLADPRRTSEDEARKLAADLPAVVWLAYGVHGDELSSPEAALLTAYHLLASRKDKMADEILANTLVFIDPTQNPDGHDRFVHSFESAEGPEPDPHPLAAEHIQPWPGGRGNHYNFDMNRDWIVLTQPETRGRIKALLEWFPLVFADLHEMGADSTYYFAPEAAPFNPHLEKNQVEALGWFGKNNARWFDRFGFSYFTREIFDAFYPGYGASWPSYHGSVAMTYEQASSRGLLMRRSDDTLFHFRETVQHHFVASLSTAETAARQRARLIQNFYRYRQSAIKEGQTEPAREYILVRKDDTSAADKLASLLAEQGVELRRAAAEFRVAGRAYPAGSYAVPLAQPAKRLVRVLLDPHVPMDPAFLKEQERRRGKKLPDEIYDVTAWSLPLQFNVESVAVGEPVQGSFVPVKPGIPPGTVSGNATVAYLVPWGTQAAGRLLAAALRQGWSVWSAGKAFTQNGRKYPRGTLIFKVKENKPELAEALRKLAASSGAEVVGTDTSWVEDGVDFGSNHVVRLKPPSIALAWDRPVSSSSAGHTRFVIERQFAYPVTVLRGYTLGAADLRRFQVLVLPSDGSGEGYASVLGPNGIRRLKDWVSAGGTLVALGGAVSFLADPRVALLAVQLENLARPGEPAKEPPRRPETPAPGAAPPPSEARAPGKLFAREEDFLKAIQPEDARPDPVPGVLVRARTDPDHWLSAGAPQTVVALVSGGAIYTPIKLDKGVNAAVFLGPDQLLASGYLWEENRKQLAYKPLLLVQREGRGLVIGFTADPNYRAYMDGLNVLFLNALFRAPAHARSPSD